MPIEPAPLKLPGGPAVGPGTLFSKLGGTKTSAGFTIIEMFEGHYLEYLGMVKAPEEDLVIFRQIPDVGKEFYPCYFKFDGDDGAWLLHLNRSGSSRVVELTNCIFKPKT